MNITQNKKDLTKTVKVIRIVWCFTIVIAIVFLALGISSLVKAGPFFENESEALLPKSGAIAMTVIGAICAMITMFLTMFGFVAPMMTKLAPKISSVMIDANKENLQTIVRSLGMPPNPSKTTPMSKMTRSNLCFATTADKKSQKIPYIASIAVQSNKFLHCIYVSKGTLECL